MTMPFQQTRLNIQTQYYVTFITLITVSQLAISAMQDTTNDTFQEHLNQIVDWLRFAQANIDDPNFKQTYTALINQTDDILKRLPTLQVKGAQAYLPALLNNIMTSFFSMNYIAVPVS
jgi:hypothetical protein